MHTVNSILVKETKFPREWKVIEELSELIVAIAQSITKESLDHREPILEEYVDSLIVLDQLRIKYKFSENEISKMKNLKLDRVMKTITEGLDKNYGKFKGV